MQTRKRLYELVDYEKYNSLDEKFIILVPRDMNMSDDIKGLLGIVVDETEVSKVMPEINSLTYRGYAAQDLCEYCRFEEVTSLILNKDLPNTIELRKFEKEEK